MLIFQLLAWGHYALLVVSGPMTILFDMMLFSFVPELGLRSLRSFWSVLEQPVICMAFLGCLLWINGRMRDAWELGGKDVAAVVERDEVQAHQRPIRAEQTADEEDGLLEV